MRETSGPVVGVLSSSGAGEAMESIDISHTKSMNPATSHSLSSKFAEFKDEFSMHFTRLEAVSPKWVLSLLRPQPNLISPGSRLKFLIPPKWAVCTTLFILQLSPLICVTASRTPEITFQFVSPLPGPLRLLFNCLYNTLVQPVQLTRDSVRQASSFLRPFSKVLYQHHRSFHNRFLQDVQSVRLTTSRNLCSPLQLEVL